MATFEHACAERCIDLYVLPPGSPETNGAVERADSSWRYEFCACYDLPHRLDDLKYLIESFPHLYNHHRPHGALRSNPRRLPCLPHSPEDPLSQHP